jgi:hypothetical protein
MVKIGVIAYKLQLSKNMKIHNVLHVPFLKPYKASSNIKPPPWSILKDGISWYALCDWRTWLLVVHFPLGDLPFLGLFALDFGACPLFLFLSLSWVLSFHTVWQGFITWNSVWNGIGIIAQTLKKLALDTWKSTSCNGLVMNFNIIIGNRKRIWIQNFSKNIGTSKLF